MTEAHDKVPIIPPDRNTFFSRGWGLLTCMFVVAGLAVVPSTTEPGWGGSFTCWGLAVITLAVFIGTKIARRRSRTAG